MDGVHLQDLEAEDMTLQSALAASLVDSSRSPIGCDSPAAATLSDPAGRVATCVSAELAAVQQAVRAVEWSPVKAGLESGGRPAACDRQPGPGERPLVPPPGCWEVVEDPEPCSLTSSRPLVRIIIS